MHTPVPVILIHCVLGIAVCDADEGEPAVRSLAELRSALGELVLGHYPGASIGETVGGLEVKLNTMLFTIHGKDRLGNYYAEPRRVEGPNLGGFTIAIQRRERRYQGPLVLPSRHTNSPYWRGFLNQIHDPEDETYLWAVFHYSHAVKQEFRDAVITLLEGKPPKKPKEGKRRTVILPP